VNPGPLIICQTFLSEENKSKYVDILASKLRESICSLIFYSRELLILNKSLIGTDQIEFHKALCEGYNDTRIKLSIFVGEENIAPPL
jgi:hypothetical protein